ncbi:MAG: peptidyl-prolyl cis-trans isomerase [Myxococcota bacterium]
MVEKLTRAVLVFIVVLISSVFVLQFGGPQAEGCAIGGRSYAAKIYGDTISAGDFEAVYGLLFDGRMSPEQARVRRSREAVLDGLVERTLLARYALEVGLKPTEDDVMSKLAKDGTVYFTLGINNQLGTPFGQIRIPVHRQDGRFDGEAAKRFIQYRLQQSIGEFTEWQASELMAHRMRETLFATIQVGPTEVWNAFVSEKDRAKIKYIQFSNRYYRKGLVPSRDAVDQWMASHAEELDAAYDAQKHRYQGLPPQVQLTQLLVPAPESEGDDVRSQAEIDARSSLQRLNEGESFASVAQRNERFQLLNPEQYGWREEGTLPAQVAEVAFGLETGGLSDVIPSEQGFYLIRLEGKRSGDVPEDVAKRELASGLYIDDTASGLAADSAERALEAIRAGTGFEEAARAARFSSEGGGSPGTNPSGASVTGAELLADGSVSGAATLKNDPATDPLAPKAQESREFGRSETPVRGAFNASPLTRAVFDRSLQDPLPEAPIRLGSDWFVFELTSRQEALREDFSEEIRERLTQTLLTTKESEALDVLLQSLKEQAESDNAIRVDTTILSYGGEGAAES